MKRINGLIISAVVLLVGFVYVQPVCAVEYQSTIVQPTELSSALAEAYYCADNYGFESVDFDNLSIGEAISTYSYTADGLEDEGYIYPVYSDGYLFMVLKEGLDNQLIIWTETAKALNRYWSSGGSSTIALIYDQRGMSITDGESIVLALSASDYLLENHRALLPSDNQEVLGLTELRLVDTGNTVRIQPSFQARDRSVTTGYGFTYCTVPFVRQTHSSTCWAACTAMMVNYHYGWQLTDGDVALYASGLFPGTGIYVGRNAYKTCYVLNNYFGDESWALYAPCPTLVQIMPFIYHDAPFVALIKWYNPSSNTYGSNHMVVATGYDSTNNRLCLWDPLALTSADWKTAYYSNTYNCYYYYFEESDPYLGFFLGTIYWQYWL